MRQWNKPARISPKHQNIRQTPQNQQSYLSLESPYQPLYTSPTWSKAGYKPLFTSTAWSTTPSKSPSRLTMRRQRLQQPRQQPQQQPKQPQHSSQSDYRTRGWTGMGTGPLIFDDQEEFVAKYPLRLVPVYQNDKMRFTLNPSLVKQQRLKEQLEQHVSPEYQYYKDIFGEEEADKIMIELILGQHYKRGVVQ